MGVVLLWHGSGPNEAAVLGPLSEAIFEHGHRVLVPDWDSSAPDQGRSILEGSLEDAVRTAHEDGEDLVLVGWSLGGTAALTVARDDTRVRAAVGLAADVEFASPLDGLPPVAREPSELKVPVILVHGRQDEIVPVDPAVAFAERGPEVRITLLDTDHAGVVGTEYDVARGVCVPSSAPAATAGLAAAVDAVEQAFRA